MYSVEICIEQSYFQLAKRYNTGVLFIFLYLQLSPNQGTGRSERRGGGGGRGGRGGRDSRGGRGGDRGGSRGGRGGRGGRGDGR